MTNDINPVEEDMEIEGSYSDELNVLLRDRME